MRIKITFADSNSTINMNMKICISIIALEVLQTGLILEILGKKNEFNSITLIFL